MAERRTAGLAVQIRRALDAGLPPAVVAGAEGITVAELERFLTSHSPPQAEGRRTEARLAQAVRPRSPTERRPRQPSQRRREQALTAARERGPEIVALWRSGVAVDAIARSRGLSVAAVRTVVSERASDFDRLRRRAELGRPRQLVRGSCERCVNAVREAAATLDRTPTVAEYIELARERPDWPAGSTIAIYWGWRQTLERAGLIEPRPRKRRADAVPARACWTALHRVATELGRVPSSTDYERVSVGRPDLPSLKTVRRRLGGWRTIVKLWPGP